MRRQPPPVLVETQAPQPSLRVILAESPTLVRAGLSMLLSSRSDIEVALEGGDAEQILAGAIRLKRRTGVVVLVGLGLTGERDSSWLIRSLRERTPWFPILACGMNASDAEISRALLVGADGYVNKECRPEDFIDAIARTAAGETVLAGVPDGWLGRIADEIEEPQPVAPSVLTDRELQVLSVATQGLTARQIGERLGVRERTVTTHLGRIYKKLGAGGRVAAIAAAANSGLVSVGVRV